MTVESAEPRAAAPPHKSTFFRQSGWMMIAAVAGGVFMFGVQILSKHFLSDPEYSSFVALVQVTNWLNIPALGLQMVFAQQTAAAITDHQKRQLIGTVRAVMLWTFCLWLVTLMLAIIYHNQWIAALRVNNPASLWLTVAVGLVMLWMPIFQGLLQGRQNFLWLGWVNILNGAGRIFVGGLIVILFHGQAAGLMAGVFVGMTAALGTGAWQNLDLRHEPKASFDQIGWLKRVVPLTLGFGVSTFIFSADAIVVQNYLGEDGKADYMFGSTLCRAIVLFTAPLAAVMFPKLVHSRVGGQKSNLLGLTLLGTGGLSFLAVIGLTIAGPFVMKIFSKGNYLAITPLIPMFACAMVFLGMGNVLLNNLMAHSRFKIVPVLIILAVAYWMALQRFHDSFKMVIQTFGIFTVIFFAICALFTWVIDKEKTPANS